jgi:hypothetical protein
MPELLPLRDDTALLFQSKINSTISGSVEVLLSYVPLEIVEIVNRSTVPSLDIVESDFGNVYDFL